MDNERASQTWPEGVWEHVELQLLKFFRESYEGRVETHDPRNYSSTQSVTDHCLRSGGVESYDCKNCRHGVTVYGGMCEKCEGTGKQASFKPSPKRVDFATRPCGCCRATGKIVRKNPYLELLEVGDTCPVCQGKMYVDGYSAIPGPTHRPPNAQSDPAQSARLLPIAGTLRSLQTVSRRAYEHVCLVWGSDGNDYADKYENRFLMLWLDCEKGHELLRDFGNRKISTPEARMADIIDRKDDSPEKRQRVAEVQALVDDLIREMKNQLWRADRLCRHAALDEARASQGRRMGVA